MDPGPQLYLSNNKENLRQKRFLNKTRQVYNGPHASNLSQQQHKKVWSKIIFEQQNQNISEIFFKEKKLGKKISIKFLEKILS